jgi:hypothetical protein
MPNFSLAGRVVFGVIALVVHRLKNPVATSYHRNGVIVRSGNIRTIQFGPIVHAI